MTHQDFEIEIGARGADGYHVSVRAPDGGEAASLLRLGAASAVLAMQYPISDRAAIEFSGSCYGSLVHQLPIDLAITQARQDIRLAMPGSLEWATPVLSMRSSDGRLFDIDTRRAARLVPAPRRIESQRRRVRHIKLRTIFERYPMASIFFSSDGDRVLFCSKYGAVRVADLDGEVLVLRHGSMRESTGFAVSPDSGRIVISRGSRFDPKHARRDAIGEWAIVHGRPAEFRFRTSHATCGLHPL